MLLHSHPKVLEDGGFLKVCLSEKFELTANSQGAHIETHDGLILRTLSYLTVNSKDDSNCELVVSFP